MKGEGKMVFKSRMKWVGLFGLVLSALSLFTHFLLARYTEEGISEFQSSITIFSWRPIFENAALTRTSQLYRRLWGPVRHLASLHPYANPRGYYAAPTLQTNGFIFVRIQGGFHEIRNSICDAVVVSRLLNATLVIPEIQSTTSSKGISSDFKSFSYLYNEDQFLAALSKDVKIVKTLPKHLKGARRRKEIPVFRVSYSASPYFYLHHVLPILKKHSVVELVISDGGCLQAILPPRLEEYQRLRCRVAFHALRFRQEVQELATKILNRLRAPGRPFIAFDTGLARDALAYHGCAELFQDVHTELIQHRRLWMIKRGIVKGKLPVNSEEQHVNGSCPLMPEEVGILLRAYGYSQDTIIYISGGEIFGGQRILIPLHAMFGNIVDRTSLSTSWELGGLYGREANLIRAYPTTQPVELETKLEMWKNSGPRPRPLPPPPDRPKTYNIEGWWGWVAESDNEPESTIMELRTNAHKLLWEAIDYLVCIEADVFFPGFDRDGKGHPNFASIVMGHRLYQSAASKTYRPDRKEVVKLLEEIRDHLYQANRTWLTSVRTHLRRSLIDGITDSFTRSKPLSFLSHPVPECSCLRHDPAEMSLHAPSPSSQLQAVLGIVHHCPAWMDGDLISRPRDKESDEDIDENDPTSSGLFFQYVGGNQEIGVGEINNKEEPLMEDPEELEGAEG
ncbi:O-fucosyltransferase 27 [Malania oleifera]|uniref:O-fucosyltransferase 27 n=1 Tax=Malania oleifera TaxID=397392 RepID=UPI0025AEA885|nr:O-fucosyltransferase 27 [Malania oleifera]